MRRHPQAHHCAGSGIAKLQLSVVLVVALACAAPAAADWQHFNTGDGLGGSLVYSVIEASDGSYWFAHTSNDGVSRFDGLHWTVHTEADGDGFRIPWDIMETSWGDIWVGGISGALRFDGTSWTRYTEDDGLVGNNCYGIMEDHDGNLWFACSHGVSRFDGATWISYTVDDGLIDERVHAQAEDRSGNLWFATREGVSRFDGTSWTSYTTADGLGDDMARAIFVDAAGDIWVGTQYGGVSRFDGSEWTVYTTADGLNSNYVTAIAQDHAGDLWFGFWDACGASRFDGGTWTSYTDDDGFAWAATASIMEDSEGNLWFGHVSYAGVGLWDRVKWEDITTSDGLPDNDVNCVAAGPSGGLWFGTDSGLGEYRDGDWTTHTYEDGMGGQSVACVHFDRDGILWVGPSSGYLSSFDGEGWTIYEDVPGVNAITEDVSGDLWFALDDRVYQFDGTTWTPHTEADGLPAGTYDDMIAAADGSIWLAATGCARYDGSTWTTYTEEDGLADDGVLSVAEDADGNLWFGTWRGGVSRFDGTTWTTYSIDDGMVDDTVEDILCDARGVMWFATSEGVSSYDGLDWVAYTADDGLVYDNVQSIAEDSRGNLLFGTTHGASIRSPDLASPQTLIWPRPAEVLPSRTLTIGFAGVLDPRPPFRFSYSFDGSVWSEWSKETFWASNSLDDGSHEFHVRARDAVGNVDPTPAALVFEVDASPPVPVITSPAFGSPVAAAVRIEGTADDARFAEYSIDTRAIGCDDWSLLLHSTSPVVDGQLVVWGTAELSDGFYELRLSVTDTLGLTGVVLSEVQVDNEPPWASETSPALVSASSGGDVFTTHEEVHLYFPPHAFADAATVTIEPSDGVPDTLAAGASLVQAGYDISWEGSDLGKPATLEMALGGERGSGDVLALYVLAEGEDWRRLGGTVSGDGATISAPIEDEGTYAIYADSGVGTGGKLSALTFTPRVFSPSGSFAADEVAIGFTLGRSGPVTVKVYNRAGRLVREVASGLEMVAGANLVRWDGRDGGGAAVPDGLYVITAEANGEVRTETLAVVR